MTGLNPLAGFYNLHHSIFCSALLNPLDKEHKNPEHQATFIHESLHFIIKYIFQNVSDPTDNESDASKLDAILEKDRQIRNKMNPSDLTKDEKQVYHTFVSDLEKENSYFNGKPFDFSNASHRRVMRAEAIVRPMEQIAYGTSIQAIKKVAPHLFDYYFETLAPKILSLAKEAESFFPTQEKVVELTENVKKETGKENVKAKSPEIKQKAIKQSLFKRFFLSVFAFFRSFFNFFRKKA